MLEPPLPSNECLRQASVEELGLNVAGLDPNFSRVCHLLASVLRVRHAAFTVIDGTRQRVRGFNGIDAAPNETLRAVSFCGHAILSSDGLDVRDAHEDPRFHDNPLVRGAPYIRYYLGLPVRSPAGFPVGALCAFDPDPRVTGLTEKMVLRGVRSVIEDELAMCQRATVDFLSGLANRRAFTEALTREWRRAYRENAKFALLIADVDGFKRANDHGGHPLGDDWIRRISRAIRHAPRRPADFAARIGGDEFAVILPDAGSVGGKATAETLCHSVEALDLRCPETPFGRATLSIGIAAAEGRAHLDQGPEQFLKRADDALYAAKRNGGNRFYLEPA